MIRKRNHKKSREQKVDAIFKTDCSRAEIQLDRGPSRPIRVGNRCFGW